MGVGRLWVAWKVLEDTSKLLVQGGQTLTPAVSVWVTLRLLRLVAAGDQRVPLGPGTEEERAELGSFMG